MDEATKNEYDFFMRVVAALEAKAQALAPLADNPPIAKVIRQAMDDADYARTLARAIADGYILVHRDRVPAVENKPVEESKVPDRYRLGDKQ